LVALARPQGQSPFSRIDRLAGQLEVEEAVVETGPYLVQNLAEGLVESRVWRRRGVPVLVVTYRFSFCSRSLCRVIYAPALAEVK